jgi:hypothetical protein
MRLQGDGVAGALYGDCDPATQQWALQRLDSQLTVSFNQARRRVAWPSCPTTYLVCTQDRTIPPWRQRNMAVHADRGDRPAGEPFAVSVHARAARRCPYRAGRSLAHRLRWSVWRRGHQARARTCHC